MQTDNRWFGLALYAPRVDETQVRDWVRAALIDSDGVVCGVRLVRLSTITSKGSMGKQRPADAKCMRDILRLAERGRIHMLFGYDTDIGEDVDLTGRSVLFFEMTATRAYESETRDLTVVGPRSAYDDAGVLSYAHALVSCFEVDYGCIVAGLTPNHIETTITFTPTSHIEDDERLRKYGPDHPRKRFGREISYYQSKKYLFRQHIPRACWGNILSPTHVEALGGEDRIRKESGANLVERWGDNLYVQLTESLWECSNSELMRLNQFFEPARFPHAPDPVYLDHASGAYIKH